MKNRLRKPSSLSQLLEEIYRAKDTGDICKVGLDKLAELIGYFKNPFNDPKLAERKGEVAACLDGLSLLDVDYSFENENEAVGNIAYILKHAPRIKGLFINNLRFSDKEFKALIQATKDGLPLKQLIKLIDKVLFKDKDAYEDKDDPNERMPIIAMKIDKLPLEIYLETDITNEEKSLRFQYALDHEDELTTCQDVIAVLQLLTPDEAYELVQGKMQLIYEDEATRRLLKRSLGTNNFIRFMNEKNELGNSVLDSPGPLPSPASSTSRSGSGSDSSSATIFSPKSPVTPVSNTRRKAPLHNNFLSAQRGKKEVHESPTPITIKHKKTK